jgi:hypothetical protein
MPWKPVDHFPAVTAMAYMLIAKPYNKSEGVPQGDAVEVAAQLRNLRKQSPAG